MYSVIVFNGAGVQVSAGAVLTVQAFVPPFNHIATTLASLGSTGRDGKQLELFALAFRGRPAACVHQRRNHPFRV